MGEFLQPHPDSPPVGQERSHQPVPRRLRQDGEGIRGRSRSEEEGNAEGAEGDEEGQAEDANPDAVEKIDDIEDKTTEDKE